MLGISDLAYSQCNLPLSTPYRTIPTAPIAKPSSPAPAVCTAFHAPAALVVENGMLLPVASPPAALPCPPACPPTLGCEEVEADEEPEVCTETELDVRVAG